MINRRYLDRGAFRAELIPIIQSGSACLDAGERDLDSIVEKLRKTATTLIALDFLADTLSGLRDYLAGEISRRDYKAPLVVQPKAPTPLAVKQEEMKARRLTLPPKQEGIVRPRGKFRVLTRDSRYRINKWGEVIGPHGKALTWSWDLLTAVPSVKLAGKACSILSLLQDAGFQKRKERKSLKPAPTVNDEFEAAAEDPEANPPKGYNSWAEARAEDPESYGLAE